MQGIEENWEFTIYGKVTVLSDFITENTTNNDDTVCFWHIANLLLMVCVCVCHRPLL